MKTTDLKSQLTFGFEQTFTTENWWESEGFTATSDTPHKREKMLDLAKAIAIEINGKFIESVDVWGHMQFETFDKQNKPSFVVTMDPGSIEVKTQPCLAKQTQKMATPLFAAAQKASLVPYRNWWYGIKGGTQGGCHVNMGGFDLKTNPFVNDPSLAIKYAAYIHNRPWLHFPFMGIDIGPGGNAMRMDEKQDFKKLKLAFKNYESNTSLKDTISHFKNTSLICEKSSFPSLAKFKDPLYLIEDRAQEALRSPEDFWLVSNLRLKILEKLQTESTVENLMSYKELHQRCLTSYWLWEKFQYWANEIGINPVFYQRFFDRQFPTLLWGDSVSDDFWIKEGRRPRKITEILKRGDVVVSKKIDTRFKRFEFAFQTNAPLKVIGDGIEFLSPVYQHEGFLAFGEKGKSFYQYLDLKTDESSPVLQIIQNKKSFYFDTLQMKWVSKKE